jgi:hypothetical protein
MSRHPHASRITAAVLGVAALSVVWTGTALARWTATGTGTSVVTASSLTTPSGSAGTATTTAVPITWTVPTAAPNAAATYTVTSSPGSNTCTAASTAGGCTVSGLTAGTAYTFSIAAAVRGWHSGTGSAGSATTTSADKYALVLAGKDNGGNWSAKATATITNTNGGAGLANYTVTGTWSRSGSGATLTCTTDTSGVCSVLSGSLGTAGSPPAIFTISSVTATSILPAASGNHTTITINKNDTNATGTP